MKVTQGETLTGRAGTAVEVLTEFEAEDPWDWDATVASWFLTCPGQSPAWTHYVLGVIHLRPIDGVKPATVKIEGATHEVLLYACNPELAPSPDPRTWSPLRPVNVVEQVVVPSDDAARELVRLCAQAVVNGHLWAEPPLSGQVEPWRSVLASTAAHVRGEH